MSDRIADAFKVVSEQRMEILTEGKQLGIVGKDLEIDGYMPHYTPAPGVLKSKNWLGIKKKSGLRHDILSHTIMDGYFEKYKDAEEALDGWIDFFEISNNVDMSNKWIQYLFNTKQVKTLDEAIEKTNLEFVLNKDFILGNLNVIVRPKVFDHFPFFDTDTGRVWYLFMANSTYLIVCTKNFGSGREKIKDWVGEVEKKQGLADAKRFEKLTGIMLQKSKRKAIPEEIKNIIRIYGFAL